MQHFNINIFSRVICLLLAAHILNICVEIPSAPPSNIVKNINVNEIESVLEMILEKGLDIENAIEEDESSSDSNSPYFELSKNLQFHNSAFVPHFETISPETFNNQTPYVVPSLKSIVLEIFPQPPQA